MPITIQEIIASDTISELVDKTNFNFDQLLLNGGGPAGPAGPAGPTGPGGGRGEKGSTWYEDTATSDPGTTPDASFPTATPLEGDYYLQFNGQVWEYTGLTWSLTTINLTGPAGPAGAAGGFGLETGYQNILNLNTVYNAPIGTTASGATTDNEGVPSVMIGGVASNIDPAGLPITLTTAYIVPSAITTGLASNIAAVLVHQKSTTTRSIVFHGGGAIGNPDLYEQQYISQLSGIFIDTDDTLILDVPKNAPSAPAAQIDMRGIELRSEFRSQYFRAGSDILMQTGVDTGFAGTLHSNFEISVGTAGDSAGNRFIVSTGGTSGTTLTEAGNITALATTSALVGKWQVRAGEIRLITSPTNQLSLLSGGELLLNTFMGGVGSGEINLQSGVGGITNTANNGNITIEINPVGITYSRSILIQVAGGTGGVDIKAFGSIKLSNYGGSPLTKPSIVLDFGNNNNTRFVGKHAWTPSLAQAVPVLAAGVSRYADPTAVLNTATSILDLVGSTTLTDMTPGAWLKKWVGGTTAISTISAGMIGVVLGNESVTVPVTEEAETLMWDNSLQLAARSSDGTDEYFSASIAKVAIAAPLVHKRDNALNSTNNNNPSSSINGAGYIKYGWCTTETVGPVNEANGGSIQGMPTSAETKIPMMTLGFGRNMPRYTGGAQDFNNLGYDYTFNFPPGLYPGQQLYLRILQYADDWVDSSARPNINYGTIRVRVPQFRRRLMPPNGAAANQTFSDWISTNGGTAGPPSYKEIKLITNATDAAAGAVGTETYLMIWDGGKTRQTSWNLGLGNTSPGEVQTELQFGWTLIPQANIQADYNLNYPSNYCFAKGALVELFSGVLIAIELVKVGDAVKSIKNGKVSKGIVTTTLVHPTNDVVPVIKLNEITAEPNHPMLVDGNWIAAKELGKVSYEFIDNWYNLEIDGCTEDSEHNYTIGGLVASGLGDNAKLNAKYQRQQKQLTQHLNA